MLLLLWLSCLSAAVSSFTPPCQLLGLDKHFPLHLLLHVAEEVQETRLFGSTPNSFGAISEGPSLLLGQPFIICNLLPPSLASKSSKPFQLLELSSTFQICLCLLLDCGWQAILLELSPLSSLPPCSLLSHLRRGKSFSSPSSFGVFMKDNGKIWALKTDHLGLEFQLRYQVVLCPGILYLMKYFFLHS